MITPAEPPSSEPRPSAPRQSPNSPSSPNAVSPRFGAPLLFILGTILYLPALRAPFLLDDYLHQSMVDGTFPARRSAFNLYNFVDDSNRAVLLERGLLPWWSHPQLTIRFLRPLSSALLWADHVILGNRPLLLHLHSFAWWMAAMLAARALFRQILAPRAALIATFIFAIAPCHAVPLAWLANREALISLTFGTLALCAHLRFREERRARHALCAAGLFALALLGGEYALCFGGYVLAIEITGRRRPIAARVVGLMPFAIPTTTYLIVRAALHYGSLGSGFYSDPLSDPISFLSTAPRRFATLLLQAWAALDNDTVNARMSAWLLALVVLAGVTLLFVPLRGTFAECDDRTRAVGKWAILGSTLALLPVLAVLPSSRLVGASVLGVAIGVALLLDHAWFPRSDRDAPSEGRAQDLTGLVALALGFAHFVHAPMTAWLVGERFRSDAVDFAAHAKDLRARIPDLENAEIVVVRGMIGSFFLPFALDEGHAPARFRTLAETGHALALRRGPRTLDIIVRKGESVFPSAHLFRNATATLAPGDTFLVPGMRATVIEVGEEGPRVARFDFDRDLEATSLTWITEDHDAFPEASLPKIGFGKAFDP